MFANIVGKLNYGWGLWCVYVILSVVSGLNWFGTSPDWHEYKGFWDLATVSVLFCQGKIEGIPLHIVISYDSVYISWDAFWAEIWLLDWALTNISVRRSLGGKSAGTWRWHGFSPAVTRSRKHRKVLTSRSIAPATNLLECARRADGGAAIIVASSSFMDDHLGHDAVSSQEPVELGRLWTWWIHRAEGVVRQNSFLWAIGREWKRVQISRTGSATGYCMKSNPSFKGWLHECYMSPCFKGNFVRQPPAVGRMVMRIPS